MNFDISEADRIDIKIRTLEFKVEQLQLRLDETITVKAPCGKVKGAKRLTIYNDAYYSFERIPYALPPVAELRFRAPKPMPTWKDILDCTNYGPKPVQKSLLTPDIEGSENCLTLNVYTNNLKPNKLRPVMVWIYGGGFIFGEANPKSYGPDYFMKKDVILVTVQYRLGALGFLSLKDPRLHTPGNAGLKDQVLALKWVKRNCSSFGGNPDCITVFGESAGGIATHLLMLSDQAKGLFHRAIAQSGVAIVDWPTFNCAEYAYDLAQATGYKGEKNERCILEYLLECTAEGITEAEQKCSAKNEKIRFGPCIEPYLTPHTVVLKPPEKLVAHAWGNNIPLLLGATSNEGLMFKPNAEKSPESVQALLETCVSFVPKRIAPNPDTPECKDVGLKLRKIHVKGETPTAEDFYEILSYTYFWHPIQNAIDARLRYAKKQPTFLYRFDFDSNKLINVYRIVRNGRDVTGVAHTDELAYLFHNVMARRMEPQSREYRTIERMIGLWTAFAETGNPNTGKINGMKNIKWHPVRNEGNASWQCLNISDELKFIDLPEMANLKAWKELYKGTKRTDEQSNMHDATVYAKSSL